MENDVSNSFSSAQLTGSIDTDPGYKTGLAQGVEGIRKLKAKPASSVRLLPRPKLKASCAS